MGGNERGTVLVVDDDEALRLLCRVNLELDGYRVLEASTAADARATLEREHVDALLVDVHLADGDGRDLLQSLGPNRPPAALFTGTAPAAELEGLADTMIPKPFEISEFRETVAGLVSGQVDSSA